jgi:hypothetical protein
VAGIESICVVIEGYAALADAIDWVLLQVAEMPDGVVLMERIDSATSEASGWKYR